ncbi:fumarylacetoacetate hydrolase family protein [Plantibacter sp. Mn2098]|uniref:fumarylacetoacetate hydrolase family protein n=1 Tax=Plantibacter sp. Mn2098 TaxID=3395266 RepID=UPI003BBD5759
MRIARIATEAGPRSVVADGEHWHGVVDPFAPEPVRTGESWPISGAALLAPVVPTVVLGMAHNGAPGDRDLPPQAFQKSARTIVGPGDRIELDASLGTINIEGELAVVIRRTSRHLRAEDVADAILGFTIGNDVTAADQIPLDDKLTQVKNGDGYTPIGPWIETDFDASDARLLVEITGPDGVRRTVADATTASLAYDVTEQLVYLTSHLTLGPGDVVLTGAPATFAPAVPGDIASITIPGIGTLENPAVAAVRPTSAHQEQVVTV